MISEINKYLISCKENE